LHSAFWLSIRERLANGSDTGWSAVWSQDNAIDSFMADKLVLRFAENEDDLLEIEKLSKNVHFDLGIHNRRLHFQYTPKTHLMILDKLTNTVIGYGTG
jgi:hypothetical protein